MMLFTWIFITRSFHQQNLNLGPGLASLPMVGNMHMLGKLPHQALNIISKKYGSLMFMHLGSVPTIVSSSLDMAKEILGRPTSNVVKYIFYNKLNITFALYGSYWR
eukprot:Gb_18159 [translate_table: standard]